MAGKTKRKKPKLTEEEYIAITTHPMIGSKILEKVGVSESILNGVRYHHKRFDLKGYPKEVDIETLPIEASIIGVADAFDAITSPRPYREQLSSKEAIEELRRCIGSQFDPKVAEVFFKVITPAALKRLEIQ